MNEYYEYFGKFDVSRYYLLSKLTIRQGPTYRLDVPSSNMDDLNTREYLDKIKAQVFENLRHTGSAPSVQQQRRFHLPRSRFIAKPFDDSHSQVTS